MNHLDTFTGIGAFTVAAKKVGIHTVGFSEIDPFAIKVLEKHFPEVPNYGDISKLDTTPFRDFIGVDLVTGGFPCTDLSQSSKGSHKGLEGTESGLFYELARVIHGSGCTWFVIENVPQVMKYLDKIKEELYGYEIDGRVFEAAQFGALCRRKRAFLVGCSIPRGASSVFDLIEECYPPIQCGGNEDVFPMCLPWKGGVSLERLGSCIVEMPSCEETNPTGIRESDGVRRGVDGRRYLALGNSIVPVIPEVIFEAILAVNEVWE